MQDRIFEIDMERSRIYWDYYKMMFLVFSLCFISGILATAMIYAGGGIDLVLAVAIMFLLFLMVILSAALMSLSVWRHENKFLDDLLELEHEEFEAEAEAQGMPLV